jgi:23S rRNA pseudouridine1911/1915/1917 synthase
LKRLPTPEGSEGEVRGEILAVDADSAGERLDSWLAARMPEHVSRAIVKNLILDGMVRINGQPCAKANRKVAAGDEIAVAIPPPRDPQPKGEDIALAILHEDADLIVIDKPAGMVVHPAPGNADGTLVNALIHHCGESLTGIGGERRPGIVHRLDKGTSGVMVAAKTQEAHAGLSAQFADHGRSGPLERLYLALAWGVFERREGVIDAPLGRSSNNRLKRAVVRPGAPDAREAITHFRVIEAFGEGRSAVSLVECRLETGRTHQIRVHLAHAGHPLLGDEDYASHFASKANLLDEPARLALQQLGRPALHAATLGFAHPRSGNTMSFRSPLPDDLTALVAALRTTTPDR